MYSVRFQFALICIEWRFKVAELGPTFDTCHKYKSSQAAWKSVRLLRLQHKLPRLIFHTTHKQSEGLRENPGRSH